MKCKARDQLEAYLIDERCPDTDVLAFDHVRETWNGYRWDSSAGSVFPLQRPEFRTDFNGIPELVIGKGDPLVVAVINTNMLVYDADRITATEADVEELANLQQLAQLLGSNVQALIREATQADPAALQAGQTVVAGGAGILVMDGGQPAEPAIALSELKAAEKAISKALSGPVGDLKKELADLAKLAAAIKKGLAQTEEGLASAVGYIQALEIRREPALKLPAKGDLETLIKSLEAHFQELLQQRNALQSKKSYCVASLSALASAITIQLGPPPQTLTEQAAQRKAHGEALGKLSETNLAKNDCDSLDADLVDAIGTVRDWLTARQPTIGMSPPNAAETAELKKIRAQAGGYAGLFGKLEPTLKTAGELLAKRGTVSKQLASLVLLVERRDKHLRSGDLCSLAAGVLRIDRPEGKVARVSWSKIRTEGFKLDVDSDFKSQLTLNHDAPVEATYRLRRPWKLNLGVDFGAVYTDVVNPKWEAVTDEDDMPTDPMAAKRKLIQRVDEDSRAGDLALFATLDLPRPEERFWGFGIQIGAGADAANPAFFAGLSFSLGKYIRLGAGHTWQQVKELADGHEEGVTVIDKTESIRQRDTFDNDWYVSLSLSINDLPFFKPSS